MYLDKNTVLNTNSDSDKDLYLNEKFLAWLTNN